LECAAIQDVLIATEALDTNESGEYKDHLDRIAIMLSRLGGRGYHIEEEMEPYGQTGFDSGDNIDDDSNFDFDFDNDGQR